MSRDAIESAALAVPPVVFRHALDLSGQTLAMYDRGGAILYQSAAIRETLGFEPNELVGQSVFEFLHPDDRSRGVAMFQQLALAPTTLHRVEVRCRDAAGEYRLLEVSLQNRLEDPEVRAIIAVYRNLSPDREREEGLRQSEERYRRYWERAPLAVFVADERGAFLDVNPAGCRQLGYSEDELSRMSITDISPPERLEECLAAFERAKQSLSLESEVPVLHRDGTVRELAISTSSLSGNRILGFARDVTTEKDLAALLKRTEAEKELMTENAAEGILWLDEQQKIVRLNLAASQILGQDRWKAQWQQVSDVVRCVAKRDWRAAFETARQRGGASLECEDQGWGPRRSLRLRLIRHPAGFLLIIRDRTEDVQRQALLRSSNRRLRQILDAIPAFVGLLEPSGRISDVNHTVVTVTGRSRPYHLGKPVWELYSFNYDGETQQQMRQAVAKAAAGEVVLFQVVARIKQEQRIPVAVTLVPLHDFAGQVDHIVAFALDISKQEASEEQLLELIRRLNEAQQLGEIGSWNWNMLTDEISWSDQTYRIFGYEPQSFRPRYEMEFMQAIHPDDRASVQQAVERSLKAGTPYEAEHRIIRPDGVLRILFERGTVETDAQGRTLRMFGTVQDVTAARLAERERESLSAQLAHATRLATMGEMVAGIAHELNQPLGAIRLYAEGCLNELPAETTVQEAMATQLREISGLADRCGTIIRQLRELSANRRQLLELVSLEEVLGDVRRLLEHELRESETSLVIQLSPNHLAVRGDRTYLRQLFINLIRNAVEAQSECHTQRRVEVRGRIHVDNQVEVSVADWGQGIRADLVDQLFSPFFTTKEEGLGLGLRISRKFAEAMGGELSYRQPDHPGAMFVLTLPAVSGEES